MAASHIKIIALMVTALLVMPVGALFTVMELRQNGGDDEEEGPSFRVLPDDEGPGPVPEGKRAGPRAEEYVYGTKVVANTETWDITDKTVVLYGNLEVQAGGTLTMDGGTLLFDVRDADPEVWKLSVDGGAAFTTTGNCLNQQRVAHGLCFSVQGIQALIITMVAGNQGNDRCRHE